MGKRNHAPSRAAGLTKSLLDVAEISGEMQVLRVETWFTTKVTRPVIGAIALSLLTALAACSKDDTRPPAVAAPVAQVDAATLAKVAETQRVSRLPMPDPAVRFDDYLRLESGNQLMAAYYARAGLPVDYAVAAERISSEYRGTSDSFRKRDLLEALKPRIDASVAEAGRFGYVAMNIDGGNLLGKYDFERKGFPVKPLADASSTRYFTDNPAYQLGFGNSQEFAFLMVPDEARARQIETLVSKFESMNLRVYAFINDANPANQHVSAVITRVVLSDARGTVLAVQPPAAK